MLRAVGSNDFRREPNDVLKVCVPVRLDVEYTADQNRTLQEVCREAMISLPIGCHHHACQLTTCRMTADMNTLRIIVMSIDVIEGPDERQTDLVNNVRYRDMGTNFVFQGHGSTPRLNRRL